ncbi:hypothetical protein F4804DRAFT_211097 [Jackrogersella minutella]|nr:hypothetical protein F4804DRAFT_211097 [Jackrogersella minutella]
MASISALWLDDAFKSAKEDFKRSLKNPALYDFSKITSIDDVLEEAKKIEKQQAKTKTLRGLKRVQPLINSLKEYSAVIEVFVQAKPDVMSLIWGPLKFILQASSSIISAFEKVIKVIADMGITLPSFKIYTQLFQSNHEICRALCLFYADILDFYAVLLNFLTNRKLNIILESLWPNIRSSIAKIQENMEHHKAMMTMNVTLEDIVQAHQARKRALEEYEDAQAFRDNQTFKTIRNEFNPHNHDEKLADILRRSSVKSGKWLENELDFTRWHDPVDRTLKSIWLHGIPGSGKTFLVANLIERMRASRQQIAFAFLSHDNQTAGDTIKVLHSLLFQLLEGDSTLWPTLCETSQSDYRRLKNDSSFVIDLLCKILQGLGSSFIVLDGLDELDELSRKHLLSSVLQINGNCPETKLLVSSREERDISLQLSSKATALRVDLKNSEDINSFIQGECESLLLEMKSYGAGEQMCLKIKEKVNTIVENAAGMFIYARLVMCMVKDQGNLHDIEEQIDNLPDGLNEVYGRLLFRIKNKPTKTLQNIARVILQWVACAQQPLREEQMLQILAIEPGQLDFTKGRKEFRDILKVCGPIIEIIEGNIQFVHFSAKEYLLHEQSDSFLNLCEAHIDAAIICSTYLCFSSLNSLFSPSSNEMIHVQENIMNGGYVMFEYASVAFLEHLKASLDNQDSSQGTRLLTALSRLQENRTNGSIDVSHVPKQVVHMFKKFAHKPDIQAFLSIVAYSQRKAQLGLLSQDEATDSSLNDPLKVLLARRNFRRRLEDMLCQESYHTSGCHCDDLKRLYGQKLYHCDQYFCYAYIRGFESKRARDQHSTLHQRPHKCSAASCLFAEVGFGDLKELQRHVDAAHCSQMTEEDLSDPPLLSIQLSNDKINILRDAVALDQAQLVKELLGQDISWEYETYSGIVSLASWRASTETLSYLLDSVEKHPYYHNPIYTLDLQYSLAIALEVENLPNIKVLLSHGAKMSRRATINTSLFEKIPQGRTYKINYSMTGYMRALSLWSPDLIAYLVNECHVEFPAQIENSEYIFEDPAIWKVTVDEARKRFSGIKQYIIWPEAYARGVASATARGCVLGARICLENGGDPDGVDGQTSRLGWTALHHAVRLASKDSAQIVKLLLQHGVNLEQHVNVRAQKFKTMKKIERWFGFEWEEIVRRIQAGEDLAILSEMSNSVVQSSI